MKLTEKENGYYWKELEKYKIVKTKDTQPKDNTKEVGQKVLWKGKEWVIQKLYVNSALIECEGIKTVVSYSELVVVG